MKDRAARWLPLALAVILATAIVINAQTLRFGRAEHHVVSSGAADGDMVIPPGGRARQTAHLDRGQMASFAVLVSPDQLPERPRARLTVEDRRGALLAASASARRNAKERGSRLEFHFPSPVALPAGPVTFAVENHGPADLDLATAPGDTYENGALEQADDSSKDRDLVWGFTTAEPISLPGRIGAFLAAAVTLLWGMIESLRPNTRGVWATVRVLTLLALPAAMLGVLAQPSAWGISDWDLYFTTHEMYRTTLLRFHQLPFWNPAVCGGTAALADPEFPAFGPGFFLELLAGTSWGFRLSLLGHLAIGGLGMLTLGRTVGLSARGAFLASLVAFASTSIPLQFVEGHVQWFAVAWIPWVAWAWLRAYRRQFPTLLPAVFLALMVFEGGIYPLFYLLVGLFTWPWFCRNRRAAFLTSLQAVLWTAGLAAVKAIPTLLWVQQYQDQVFATSAFTLPHLQEIFLGRHLHGATVLPNQGGGWHEYGSYVGPVALLLLVFGALHAKTSRMVRALLIIGFAALIVSSLGPWLAPALETLSILPRSNLSRLVLVAVFTGALLAGFGLDRLARLLPRAALAGLPLIGMIALDLFTITVPLSLQAFRVPPLELPVRAASPLLHTRDRHEIRIDGTDYTRITANARAGFGSLALCTPIGPVPAVLDWRELETPTGVTVADHDARATLLSWTPNRMVVRVTTPRPALVTLQANAAPGWQVNGTPLPETSGLLRTTVPAGEHVLTFAYRPPGLAAGLTVSVLTLLAAFWSFRRRLGNRKAPALDSRP